MWNCSFFYEENLEPEKGKIQNELEKLESQDCENIAELKKTIENMEQYWNLMIEIKQMQSKKQNIVVVEKHGKVYLCVNDDFSLQTNTLTTSSFKVTFCSKPKSKWPNDIYFFL